MSVPNLSHELIQLGTHSNKSRDTQIHSCLSLNDPQLWYFREIKHRDLFNVPTDLIITNKEIFHFPPVFHYKNNSLAHSVLPSNCSLHTNDPLLKQSCVSLSLFMAGWWIRWSEIWQDDFLIKKQRRRQKHFHNFSE